MGIPAKLKSTNLLSIHLRYQRRLSSGPFKSLRAWPISSPAAPTNPRLLRVVQ
jgi:hypothetical protein